MDSANDGIYAAISITADKICNIRFISLIQLNFATNILNKLIFEHAYQLFHIF